MKVFVVTSPHQNRIDSVWSTREDSEARRRDLDHDSTADEWSIEEYELDGGPTRGAETEGVEALWTRAAALFAEKHGEHGAIMKLIPNKDVCRGCGATLTIERNGGSYVPVERRSEPDKGESDEQ